MWGGREGDGRSLPHSLQICNNLDVVMLDPSWRCLWGVAVWGEREGYGRSLPYSLQICSSFGGVMLEHWGEGTVSCCARDEVRHGLLCQQGESTQMWLAQDQRSDSMPAITSAQSVRA